MTPYQYAKAELAAGRYPEIIIEQIGSIYCLRDREWGALVALSYVSRCAAERARSKVLDKAAKAHWRAMTP